MSSDQFILSCRNLTRVLRVEMYTYFARSRLVEEKVRSKLKSPFLACFSAEKNVMKEKTITYQRFYALIPPVFTSKSFFLKKWAMSAAVYLSNISLDF